jgi:hypothetical protein
MDFWRQTGWPIVTADSDTHVFSASQARNNAVRQAKTGTVVICERRHAGVEPIHHPQQGVVRGVPKQS